MSVFKFFPWTDPSHPQYNPLFDKLWFKAWNHWLNPFGNWHEPLPFPEKRAEQAEESKLHPWLWWTLRNPLYNLKAFWLGIVPIGRRYEWISPVANGWDRSWPSDNWSMWKKGVLRLPYYHRISSRWDIGLGWDSTGRFSLNFRRVD